MTWLPETVRRFCEDYKKTCVDYELAPPYDDCMVQAAGMEADQSRVDKTVLFSDTLTCRRLHLE